MSSKKILREVERALSAHGIRIVERICRTRSHDQLVVADATGATARVTISASPSSPEACVNMVVQMARRNLRGCTHANNGAPQ